MTVHIIGGGLVGPLMAVYLAKKGFSIEMHERRADMRVVMFRRVVRSILRLPRAAGGRRARVRARPGRPQGAVAVAVGGAGAAAADGD